MSAGRKGAGTGLQTINKNKFNYRRGNLFLITPQDAHSFEIATLTQFFFLRFNASFIKTGPARDGDICQRMKYILQNASHLNRAFKKHKGMSPSEFRRRGNQGIILTL